MESSSSLKSPLFGIRLVSWDVDGTLFSYESIAPVLARWLLNAGVKQGWREGARLFVRTLQFHRAVEAQRRRQDSAVLESELARFSRAAEWERHALDHALRVVCLRPGVGAMIERFAAAGIPQVALSDFECGHKVEALGLRSRIAGTYSCRSLGFWKPSPFALARVQRDFGVTPAEHLHIGDRIDSDGLAAARSGCRFLHVRDLPALVSEAAVAPVTHSDTLTHAYGRTP